MKENEIKKGRSAEKKGKEQLEGTWNEEGKKRRITEYRRKDGG
jgi:hypothetical protein